MVYHLVTSNAVFDYIHTFDSFFLSFHNFFFLLV